MKNRRTKLSPSGLPDWRAFELLVTAIEEHLAPKGAIVKSPDRLRDLDSGRFREVDASIRYTLGSVEILVTIECRKRTGTADVTWIEQLATKRNKVGAARTIAVSAKGFSETARQTAERYGIDLRVLGEIGPEDIDAWFAPAPLVHMYRSVESLTCKAILTSGSEIEVDGMEARFRHPGVHGIFPGAVFLSFIEMKDPETFWRVPISGTTHEISFVLDAQDANLIPVPLGEQRKHGVLELLVEKEYYPVKTLILEMAISYKSYALHPEDGRHYVYGPPEAAVSRLSHFESEMLGVPVQIDHFSKQESVHSATISFPSGAKLHGNLVNPRLTDMTKVDVELIQGLPVTIKVRGAGAADGVFVNPLDNFFEDENHKTMFCRQNFMFLRKEDIQEIRRSAKENPEGQRFWDLVHILPRNVVEYIDLSPAINVGRKEAPEQV